MLDSVGIQIHRIMMCDPDSHQSLLGSKHNSAGKKKHGEQFFVVILCNFGIQTHRIHRCPPPKKKHEGVLTFVLNQRTKVNPLGTNQRSSCAAKNTQLIATYIAVVKAEALLWSSCTIIHHSIDLISAGTHAHLHLSCFNFRKVS